MLLPVPDLMSASRIIFGVSLLVVVATPAALLAESPTEPPAGASPSANPADSLAPAVRALLSAGVANVDDDEALAPTLAAIAALGEGALPALIAALKDPDEEIRVVAAKALTQIPGTKTTLALVGGLHDESSSVRMAIAESLGTLRDRSAVPALLQQLQTDLDMGVRYACLTSLGMIGDPAASATLVKYTSDKDGPTRLWAMDALCVMKDPQAAARAVELARDPNPAVSGRTIVACEAQLNNPQGHTALIAAALSSDFQTSVMARRGLGIYMQNPAAGASLTKQMRSAAQAGLRQPSQMLHASFVLADLGDAQAVEGLVGALKNSNVLIRLMAMRQLGELGDRRAVPALIEGLSDSKEMAAAMAYNSLQWFAADGDARAAEAVKNFTGKKFDQPLPRSGRRAEAQKK
jgi:HEAT repeat protein